MKVFWRRCRDMKMIVIDRRERLMKGNGMFIQWLVRNRLQMTQDMMRMVMIMLSMSMSMVIISYSNKQVDKQKYFAWEQTEKVKQKKASIKFRWRLFPICKQSNFPHISLYFLFEIMRILLMQFIHTKKTFWEQKYLKKIHLCRYVSGNCFARVVTLSCYMSLVTCVSE